jgi:hypothetical protein
VTHRDGIKRKLEAILLEQPPPTLDKVTERLGYKANTYLRENYPNLCRAIVRRHARYRKTKFKAICHQLEAILHEEPPLSLRATATRVGYDSCYLRSRFPDVIRAIAERYAGFKKSQSFEKKKEAVATIRSTALRLHSNGEYPSLKRVKKAVNGPLGVVTSEAGAVLREVRRELGLTKDG